MPETWRRAWLTAPLVRGSTCRTRARAMRSSTTFKLVLTGLTFWSTTPASTETPCSKMTDEQWQQVIAVDLSGVFFMTRAASRLMRAAGRGRIVNISSASWMGNIGQANDSAAKAGVVGLSRTAAKELARAQVTVNAICPGFIDTQMTRGIPDTIREQQVAKIPLGRMGQPSDVAAVVAFLASDEAGYVTGEVINVGGGYVL